MSAKQKKWLSQDKQELFLLRKDRKLTRTIKLSKDASKVCFIQKT